jgi:hypothetical protein
MSIQLAIPVRFSLTGFNGDAEAFDEDILTTEDDYLDSPIDEFGEAAAIRDLYEPAVADDPEE